MENGAEMKQKKAILAGCKYYLQVMINLYPSGCPNKSCYSIIHGLFGYLSSFQFQMLTQLQGAAPVINPG